MVLAEQVFSLIPGKNIPGEVQAGTPDNTDMRVGAWAAAYCRKLLICSAMLLQALA